MSKTIECLIKRKTGTTVTLDDTDYKFKPNAAGDHVCDVENEGHINTLLDIPRAYRLYEVAPGLPATNDETGDTVNLLGDKTGGDDDTGDDTDTDTGDDDTDTGENQTKQDTTQQQPETEEQERERLIAIYVERFGKKPHHMMGVKRIREELGMDEE